MGFGLLGLSFPLRGKYEALENRNRSLLFKEMSLSVKLARGGVLIANLNCDTLHDIQNHLVNQLLWLTLSKVRRTHSG